MPHPLPAGSTIAHLIETDGPGGAERVVAYLISRLAEEGFQNVALLPAAGEGWLAKQLPQASVEIVHIPLLGVPIRHSLQAVVATLRRTSPLVVHSHEFTMSVLGSAACWRLKLPHIITMHGGRYHATRPYRRVALGVAARCASRIVAVSQTFAERLAKDLLLRTARIHVVHNGIPPIPHVVPTLRAELGLPAGAPLVLAVGNLYPVKGHAHLLRAVASLPMPLRNQLHVAIAGRGEEEQTLRSLAAALGIESRIHLLGLRTDIPNLLRSATLFVLPSLSEALPLALLEGMRAGLPVIASRVGEIPAVLQFGKAGILVAPGDATDLARALSVVLTDPGRARALADHGERVAAEYYSIEQMADRYRDVYARAGMGPARTHTPT